MAFPTKSTQYGYQQGWTNKTWDTVLITDSNNQFRYVLTGAIQFARVYAFRHSEYGITVPEIDDTYYNCECFMSCKDGMYEMCEKFHLVREEDTKAAERSGHGLMNTFICKNRQEIPALKGWRFGKLYVYQRDWNKIRTYYNGNDSVGWTLKKHEQTSVNQYHSNSVVSDHSKKKQFKLDEEQKQRERQRKKLEAARLKKENELRARTKREADLRKENELRARVKRDADLRKKKELRARIKRDGEDLKQQIERERKQFEDERSGQLRQLQRRETELKQQIEREKQMKFKEKNSKNKEYIVVYPTGAVCRQKQDLSSKLIGVVPIDTVVTVEVVDGRRCLISSPMFGWVSLHTSKDKQVLKKINTKNYSDETAADSNATATLRANQLKQERLMRKKFDAPDCDICLQPFHDGIEKVVEGKFIHWNCFGCSICDEYIRKRAAFDIADDGTFMCSNCSAGCNEKTISETEMKQNDNKQELTAWDLYIQKHGKEANSINELYTFANSLSLKMQFHEVADLFYESQNKKKNVGKYARDLPNELVWNQYINEYGSAPQSALELHDFAKISQPQHTMNYSEAREIFENNQKQKHCDICIQAGDGSICPKCSCLERELKWFKKQQSDKQQKHRRFLAKQKELERINNKVINYPNGDIYHGQVNAYGQQHGHGVHCWKDTGAFYEGDWKTGKINGYGTHVFANGTVYIGDCVDSHLHGFGKKTISNSDVYEGGFKNDKYDGFGRYLQHEGFNYEGQFVADDRHGFGKATDAMGNVIHDGQWRYDKAVPVADNYETTLTENKNAESIWKQFKCRKHREPRSAQELFYFAKKTAPFRSMKYSEAREIFNM